MAKSLQKLTMGVAAGLYIKKAIMTAVCQVALFIIKPLLVAAMESPTHY
jgi:hypothetical protein